MARPKKDMSPLTISIADQVREILEKDAGMFGISKGAYISQLIMQKHIEMISTGLLEKLSPEQLQMAITEMQKA